MTSQNCSKPTMVWPVTNESEDLLIDAAAEVAHCHYSPDGADETDELVQNTSVYAATLGYDAARSHIEKVLQGLIKDTALLSGILAAIRG